MNWYNIARGRALHVNNWTYLPNISKYIANLLGVINRKGEGHKNTANQSLNIATFYMLFRQPKAQKFYECWNCNLAWLVEHSFTKIMPMSTIDTFDLFNGRHFSTNLLSLLFVWKTWFTGSYFSWNEN